MWNWNEEIADWVHWKFNLPNRPNRVHAMKAVVNIVPTLSRFNLLCAGRIWRFCYRQAFGGKTVDISQAIQLE